MQAGKHGVIVLNPGRRSSLQNRSTSESESEDVDDLSESNDPAVIRKIVRRQAALASAGRRKATIAATHQKRSNANRRPIEASVTTSSSDASSSWELLSQQMAGPGALAITSHRLDPFLTHPVDFEIFEDSDLLHSMFNQFTAHMAPLLDLRLPTQDDHRFGRRYSWQKELPRMALSSPPCFWALMLSASAQVGARTSNSPATNVMTLRFRHMTIKSINKRLDASTDDLSHDFGLLIGIAMLGGWEFWWGSSEACKAHADGLQILHPQFQDKDQPHDLLAQILTFANTFGSRTTDTPTGFKYAQALPRIVELQSEASVGFTWIARRVFLDQRLVRSICSSPAIAKMENDMERSQAIREVASAIMSFNTKPRLRDICTGSDWSQDQHGDRVNLEVHIILQAAGVSLMTFLASSAEEAGTANIDAIGMCEEVADLARSVICVPVYDQVVLWALVTVFALSHQAPTTGIDVVRVLVHRLQLHFLPAEAMETYLGAFVFLESARQEYRWLLTSVMMSGNWPEVDLEASSEVSECFWIE